MSALVKINQKESANYCCPVCHFSKQKKLYRYFYKDKESDIVECGECGHRWITPLPLDELKTRSMDSVDDGELFDSRILRYFHKQLVVLPEIHEVRKLKVDGRGLRLLDIACGTGWSLSHWKEHHFHVLGLEASDYRSKICREKYDIDVITGFIEDFRSGEKFDVITMRHVLEHIENPIVILEKVKDLLKEDGILSITVPNINSIGRYLFQEKHAWVLPCHLHFYYPKTLKQLLERSGFQKLKLYQKPSPLWYPDSFINLFNKNGLWAKMLARMPRFLLMMLLSPVTVVGWMFGLSDNLTIIVSKKN